VAGTVAVVIGTAVAGTAAVVIGTAAAGMVGVVAGIMVITAAAGELALRLVSVLALDYSEERWRPLPIMVATTTATITGHMPVHPHLRFGIGAMPIRATTLRSPSARLPGDKLFSNFRKVRVRLAARETVIEPIGLNTVSAGLVREHIASIEVR